MTTKQLTWIAESPPPNRNKHLQRPIPTLQLHNSRDHIRAVNRDPRILDPPERNIQVRERLDRDTLWPKRIAGAVIRPGLIVGDSALLPPLVGALLAVRLAAIALATFVLVVGLQTELLGGPAEPPATAADVQRTFLAATVLAALGDSVTVADAVVIAAPVRAEAAAAGLGAAANSAGGLGVADGVLLGEDGQGKERRSIRKGKNVVKERG